MRLATIIGLFVLCLAPALAQPTTSAPSERKYVSYYTELTPTGPKVVLLKPAEDEKKIKTVEVEWIFWRTGSQVEQQLIQVTFCGDPYRCSLSPAEGRKLDGEAIVRYGIANGIHVRPATGTGDVKTPVWYKAGDGTYKALWYLISWYSLTDAPKVTLLPDAEPAPAVQ